MSFLDEALAVRPDENEATVKPKSFLDEALAVKPEVGVPIAPVQQQRGSFLDEALAVQPDTISPVGVTPAATGLAGGAPIQSPVQQQTLPEPAPAPLIPLAPDPLSYGEQAKDIGLSLVSDVGSAIKQVAPVTGQAVKNWAYEGMTPVGQKGQGLSSVGSGQTEADKIAEQADAIQASERDPANQGRLDVPFSSSQGEKAFVQGRSKNWLDALKEGVKEAKFIPFSDAGEPIEAAAMLYTINKIDRGQGTKEDEDRVDDFLREAQAPKTIGYGVVEGLIRLPAFAGELGITAGAYTVPATITKVALRKALGRYAEKKAVQFAINTAGRAVGATAQTVASSSQRIAGGAIENVTPTIIDDINSPDGDLKVVHDEDPIVQAVYRAFMEQGLQVASERFGNVLARTQPAKVFQAAMKRFFRMNPSKKASDFLEVAQNKYLLNGFVLETAEEEVIKPIEVLGGFGTSKRGEENTMANRAKEQYSLDNYIQQSLVLAGPGLGGMGINKFFTKKPMTIGDYNKMKAKVDAALQSDDPEVRMQAANEVYRTLKAVSPQAEDNFSSNFATAENEGRKIRLDDVALQKATAAQGVSGQPAAEPSGPEGAVPQGGSIRPPPLPWPANRDKAIADLMGQVTSTDPYAAEILTGYAKELSNAPDEQQFVELVGQIQSDIAAGGLKQVPAAGLGAVSADDLVMDTPVKAVQGDPQADAANKARLLDAITPGQSISVPSRSTQNNETPSGESITDAGTGPSLTQPQQGVQNANTIGQQQVGNIGQYQGVAPGAAIPADQAQVQPAQGPAAGGGDSDGRGAQVEGQVGPKQRVTKVHPALVDMHMKRQLQRVDDQISAAQSGIENIKANKMLAEKSGSAGVQAMIDKANQNIAELRQERSAITPESVAAKIGKALKDRADKNYAAKMRKQGKVEDCLLYTSPSPRDRQKARMPSSA